MVNLFFKRIIFIKEITFISSGNTYCDVILNVDHLGFVIRQFFVHDLPPFKVIIYILFLQNFGKEFQYGRSKLSRMCGGLSVNNGQKLYLHT